MIYAYDKIYLEKARIVLGRMLDYAAYDLNINSMKMMEYFINSNYAKRFEDGDYEVLVGMSGIELVYEILNECNVEYIKIKPKYTLNRSEEYWGGWALAYYQWQTAMSFKEIIQFIPINEIVAMYVPYHEMDIQHFVDAMSRIYRNRKLDTALKTLRLKAGMTQQELSIVTGVSIRTIQQYEQRQKNINKAQVETIIKFSRALCCSVEELIEKV